MHCQTCSYCSYGFCAVNPTHIKGMWSQACNQYEHDETKVIKCGNCSAFSQGECLARHLPVSKDDKCDDFYSQDDIDWANEQNDRDIRDWVLSNIYVKLAFGEGKFQIKLLK